MTSATMTATMAHLYMYVYRDGLIPFVCIGHMGV